MLFNLLGYLGVLTMVYSFSALSDTNKNFDTVEINVKFNKYSEIFEPKNKKSILVAKRLKPQLQKIVSK